MKNDLYSWIGSRFKFPYTITDVGFFYGPLIVYRVTSDKKWGIVVYVGSRKKGFEIRISPKGRNLSITEAIPVPQVVNKYDEWIRTTFLW